MGSDVSVRPIIPEVPITRPIPEIPIAKPIPEVPVTKPKPPQVISNEGGLRHQRRRNVAAKVQIDDEEKGSTEEFGNITGQHHEPDDEDHFCVVEDYPCGPNNSKVHVCHYSARDGYKTFCVPEADSDALRFYPKDYCGACVGFGHGHVA